MFEFTYQQLSPGQVRGYLERIGWQGAVTPDKGSLDRLVWLHQCQVPFENLDILAGRLPLPLGMEELYGKVVVRRRGGFCFELNNLFTLLLRAVGYDACACMCRVAAKRRDLGYLSHQAVLVRLDGKHYLCDVGLGGPMAPFAIEVSPRRQTVFAETYWVEPVDEGWYLLRRAGAEAEGEPVIVFSTQPFQPQDFEPLSRFYCYDTTRMFRLHRMVNRRTPDGYRKVWDNTLVVRDGDVRQEIPFTDEEFPAIARQWFGLAVE